MAIDKFYDKFLELLNEGDLLYKGNFIFKFHPDSMTVYSPVEGKLVNEELEYSPVSLTRKTPVPFVEANKRVDWMLEFGILMRIHGNEFDPTVDIDYPNIVSVLDALNGAVTDIEGTRYASKTQEPNYNGYTVLGEYKYAIMTMTMQVTEIAQGYFGQDSVWSLGGDLLDVVEVNTTSTKRFYTSDKKSELTNDFNKPIGRGMVFEITFNYNGESDILLEAQGKQGLKQEYTLSETFSGQTPVTYTVTCESAVRVTRPNSVMRITARFVEV